MGKQLDRVYVALIIALLLIGVSLLLSMARPIMLPIQEMETRAELTQSQSLGKPISDAEIETHLRRLRYIRRVDGIYCIPILLAGTAVVAAIILLPRESRSTGQAPTFDNSR